MNSTDRNELLELAHAYLERSLSDEQMEALESQLEADPEARRIFVDFTHDHAALHWRQVSELSEEDKQKNIEAFSDFRPHRLPSLWQVCAAGAVISLLALVLLQSRAEKPSATFATMEKTESARWESGNLPTSEGVRLQAGKLHLTQGLATISFDSGAEVILESPAVLELIDPMNCVLHSGTAVAEVTQPAEGFQIQTPTANVIDHGTRFVVNVAKGTGATKTQVFEGLVEVKLPHSGESVQLETGQQNFVAGEDLGEAKPEIEEGTWVTTAPKSLGPDWMTLTTGAPGATDGYAWGGEPNDNVSDELLLLKHSIAQFGPHRKAFLRFAIASKGASPIEEAVLNLHFTPTGWGLASLLNDSQFRVYGITSDELDTWSHDALNWTNAPANVVDSGVELDPAKTTLLGEFSIPRGVQSGSFGIRGDKLTHFLNADQNGLATLVVVRMTQELRSGGLVHGIASSRHPYLPAPNLQIRLKGKEE